MPSHIDNPTLTLQLIMKYRAASEVGFEPRLTDAAGRINVRFWRELGEFLSSRALRTVNSGFLYQL
jgi:hypothetical protein